MKRVAADISKLPEWQQTSPDAHLQAWFMENMPKEQMVYREAANAQIVFFRDECREMFDKNLELVEVVSTHRSKSIDLPVYHYKLKNGIEMIVRDNFHGVKVSVYSPIALDFPEMLFTDGITEPVLPVYCEGFEKAWVFDTHRNNKKLFTVGLESRKYFSIMMFLLKSQLYEKRGKISTEKYGI